MKFGELLQIVRGEPVFTTGLLLAGESSPSSIRAQLSRWVREGRIVKLKRGYYALAEPYTDSAPSPFAIANAMEPASYVSCQSALAWYGLVPEHVPSVVSVTSGRTGAIANGFGTFIYRHFKPSLLWGFVHVELPGNKSARMALPEKALLDLIYLEPSADSADYLEELRLQNTEQLDSQTLASFAGRFGKPKLMRAAQRLDSSFDREEAPLR